MLVLGNVKNPRELVAAGFSGAVGTGVDVATLVLLVNGGTSIPVSAFIAACAGAVMNFGLNKYIAFPIHLRQLARFGVVAVAAALLMAVAMFVVAVKLGVPYLVAKLVCAAIVFAAWTYPAQRRIVFRRAAAISCAPAEAHAQ